jgi:hypothetical protein
MTHEDTRTSAQRALDAAEYAQRTGCTALEAAAKHRVGRTEVFRVKAALRSGTPELVAAVRAGTLKSSQAERLAKLTPEQQRSALRVAGPAAERSAYGDRARMTKQAHPRTSGLGVVPVILADWQQHPEVIADLDPDVLSAFLADLKRARQSASTLIHLIERQTHP